MKEDEIANANENIGDIFGNRKKKIKEKSLLWVCGKELEKGEEGGREGGGRE